MHNRIRHELLLIAAALVVGACSARATNPSGEGDFLLTLRAPEAVAAGDSIVFELEIQNISDKEEFLGFDPAQSFIPQVFDQLGQLVWRPRDGRRELAQKQPPKVFAPGDRITLREVWNLKDLAGRVASPGTYEVRAALLADEYTLEARPVTVRLAGMGF